MSEMENSMEDDEKEQRANAEKKINCASTIINEIN
jgi:hypothetical protein